MQDKSKSAAGAGSPKGEPFDFWPHPAVISENNFKYKSLSNWAFNISMGCSHACRFCYVPDTSANWQAEELRKYGVEDPDEEWGSYSLLRPWDEHEFLKSLKSAEETPQEKLKPDGNRAVMFCTTTDAYQTFKASTLEKSKLLNQSAEALVRKALEAIRDHSTLNVRILTRSPLAKRDFDLFKSFRNRLVFGMSLPTMNDKLSKIYEPHAPGPAARLKTLQEAKAAGLHVFVAVAPTYPECDEVELRATLTKIRELDPITIFHEPINIRAENVARIEIHAASLNPPVKVNTAVFDSPETSRKYALESLQLMQRVATELGLLGRLKLRKQTWQNLELTRYQRKLAKQEDERYYDEKFKPWIEGWWRRISEWPGKR
jgi:DNA repair photolyase